MFNLGQLVQDWFNSHPAPQAAASAATTPQVVPALPSELQITVGGHNHLIEPLSGPGGVVPQGGTATTTVDASQAQQGVTIDLGQHQAVVNGQISPVPNTAVSAHGSPQNDVLLGGTQDTVLTGGGGNDVMVGGSGATTFIPGSGNSVVIGGSGHDTVNYAAQGQLQVDLAHGIAQHAGGTDTLVHVANVIGSPGSDVITGDAHDNVIVGGPGADVLTGGGGHDTFAYLSAADFGDVITDFHTGVDTIAVSRNALPAQDQLPTSGPLPAGQLAMSTQPAQAHTAFVFNPDTHILYAEESGGPVAVAMLPGASVTAHDIQIV